MRQARLLGTFFSVVLTSSATFVGGLALTGCEDAKRTGSSDCRGPACANTAPALDFKSKQPTFSAHLRVLDAAGKPVSKASVMLDQRTTKSTDAEGRVVVKDLDARKSLDVRVSTKGAAPHLAKTDAYSAGQRTQTLTLAKTAFSEQVDLKQGVTVQKDFGQLELAPQSIGNKDGSRVSKGKLEITDLASTKAAREQLAAVVKGKNRRGEAALLKSVQALVHVGLTDGADAPLNLAPTKAAGLVLKLPPEARAAVGEELSLWSLADDGSTLQEEGRCTVEPALEAGGARVCKGHVPHFSSWALVETEESAQCINARIALPEDGCLRIEVERVYVESCDAEGENCVEQGLRELTLSSDGSATPQTCGLLPASATQRVSVLYDVDASGCRGADARPNGRRLKRGEPERVKAEPAVELLRALQESASAACSERCSAITLRIDESDVADAPLLTDRDNDGFYAAASAEGTHAADCDDADDQVFPGAPEPFCSTRDLNCDGEAGVSEDSIDDARWNAECDLCGLRAGAEKPGNLRDEDCNGSAADRDGDGHSAPEDCDDFDAQTSPDAREIAGNHADENCDGVALDWDGDGVASPAHAYLFASAGLDKSKFTDCDDFDAATRSGASVQSEVGALRDYFDAGERSADYCGLFEASGVPGPTFLAQAIDRNCDGKVTDADGDGYAAPGDLSLGEAQASDCNDFDPRLHARNAAGTGCQEAPPMDAMMCQAAPRAAACPTLQVGAGVVQTACEEALDAGMGTGKGVCAFAGWSEGDPLTLEPGKLWGPCDGGGPLAECPSGAQCGGPLPYSAPISSYLRDTFTAGKELTFKGMCFPTCSL